ncbi:hypothetical protein Nepgr_019793 [Nepenthes gracilis]|uniref:Uncharacterized protein n=1 Tax=Nepenthes gracilis TaxID=150966 RepID=A0AAD3XUG0_NEPGR|nr:hypothetical protein Nepgr_019793 [Nepenthes gracilis]
MAGHLSKKMKRKDLDEVSDEFSDFSLSSPARKIRRLDAGLPPIIEEEEAEIPLDFDQPLTIDVEEQPTLPVIEELPSVPQKEDRAIVLFKSMNSPLFQCPSSFSLDPGLLSNFKNKSIWHSQPNRFIGEDEMKENNNSAAKNKCLAVVTWAPPHKLNRGPRTEVSQGEVLESMDPEAMEVEDNAASISVGMTNEFDSARNETPVDMSPASVPLNWNLVLALRSRFCYIPQLAVIVKYIFDRTVSRWLGQRGSASKWPM